MKRECNLEEITDGKLYQVNDMVKVGCNGCKGCSKCCVGMGDSIVLDPYDVVRIVNYTKKAPQELLQEHISLNVIDGLVLPSLAMADDTKECTFLNEEGRCSIHSARPGICRIFPLGRLYQEKDFSYILQVKECPATNKTKEKVSKWIDTTNRKEYHKYINDWHFFLKDLEKACDIEEEDFRKNISMFLLHQFYLTPYENIDDFYIIFYKRLIEVKSALGMTNEI